MNRIDKLNEMLKDSPRDSFLLHALGLEYSKIDLLNEAISSFEKVIQNDPEYVGTYYHLGKCYEKKADDKQAISIYGKGIEMATKLRDIHARNELQMALDDIMDV